MGDIYDGIMERLSAGQRAQIKNRDPLVYYNTDEERVLIQSALSRQIGGDHYRNKAIQPIEFILANALGFCEGNVVKYVTRWKDKGGLADLKKARHYLDFLIEQEESKNE